MAEPEARDRFEKVFGDGRRERIERQVPAYPRIVGTDNFESVAGDLKDVEFIFSTWGTPKLTVEQIGRMPALKALFYGAGTVQYFARPFLEAGITVVSAWRSISVPVAAYTAAQIILASKGYFPSIRNCRTHEGRLKGKPDYPGVSDAPVAILGAGSIGSMVIDNLRPYPFTILVFDPFMSDERAAELNVERVSLEDAFARGLIVSNHIANLPTTEGMLRKDLFARMPQRATFINTGRGATIDEEGMLDILAERPDLTALIDVTWPEPPRPDSRLYSLDNVFLTPHIAGSQGKEILLQADYAIEEFERYVKGEPLRYQVTAKMLETMA